MTKLTDKQKEDYLANPNHCPYCGAMEIEASEWDGDSEKVECLSCGAEWTDIYNVVDIQERDDEDEYPEDAFTNATEIRQEEIEIEL